MLITRFRQAKNKKGITLLEALAAVTITAILAVVLSMMIVPVFNTYSKNDARVQLEQAVTARLNDIAMYLRGAKDIYLSDQKRTVSNVWYNRSVGADSYNANRYFSDSSSGNYPTEVKYVLPEIRSTNYDEYSGVIQTSLYIGTKTYDSVTVDHLMYSFVLDNYYGRYANAEGVKNSAYLYPELIIAAFNKNDRSGKRFLTYGSYFDLKLPSDDYQEADTDIYCPNNSSMYFKVKKNADNGNRLNALEIHLKMKKGDITYEGTKTIVCENLMINNDVIHTNRFDVYTSSFKSWKQDSNGNWIFTKEAAKEGTTYYTVWFCPNK